jgi:hypothetical protein
VTSPTTRFRPWYEARSRAVTAAAPPADMTTYPIRVAVADPSVTHTSAEATGPNGANRSAKSAAVVSVVRFAMQSFTGAIRSRVEPGGVGKRETAPGRSWGEGGPHDEQPGQYARCLRYTALSPDPLGN